MKMENGMKSDETLIKYGRDYLLQLRMHPMSLHKPDLPDCEIAKNKLYLHQVDNMASDIPLNPYPNNFSAFMRPENIAKFLHQCSYSGPRNSSYYTASGQKSNSVTPPSKYYHSSFSNNYFNSPYRQSPAYKADIPTDDFFENITDAQTAPWLKEAFSMCTSENAWNVNQNIMPKNICSSKRENTNLKSKKKLSIIDPKTGKDILEEIGDTSTTPSQSSLSSKENTEDEMKAPNDQEKNVNMTSDEEYEQATVSEKQSGDNALLSKVYEKTMYSESHAGNETLPSDSNMNFGADNMENEEFDKSCPAAEMLAPTSVSDRGQSNLSARNGNSDLKERIGILRDKMYAMRQEQQKMFILQSFLRFKKHQLDESFGSLDDKKIDMVNWEYNLYNKAKKLHEKEQWIETKTRDLKKREKDLDEKEKWLNQHHDILKKRVKNASQENANEKGKEDHSYPKMVGNCDAVDYSSGDVCATTSLSEQIPENAYKKTVAIDKESESCANLKTGMKKHTQLYSNDNESETSGKQLKYDFGQHDDLDSSYNRKRINSECPMYYSGNIKY